MSIEDHPEDGSETTSAKETASARKPYSPPTLTVVGSVEQLTQGSTGPIADIKKLGSL